MQQLQTLVHPIDDADVPLGDDNDNLWVDFVPGSIIILDSWVETY